MRGSAFLNNTVILGLFAIFSGAGGLRDVVLQVPTAVLSGSDVSLVCLYDLEGDQLYTVSWYKGRQEFFRYVLKELPHTRVFPLPGINVDVVASGTERVVLREVQRALTGLYRCEVSSDGDFHTQTVLGYMNVVDELEGKPVIRLEKGSYSAGDTLRGNCSSPPSTPPANVTWYLNGEKEAPSTVEQHGNSSGSVTTASLSVELTSARFQGGKLSVRCVADLFSVTQASHELWLDEDRPRLASVLGTRDSAACRTPIGFTILLQMSLATIFLYNYSR